MVDANGLNANTYYDAYKKQIHLLFEDFLFSKMFIPLSKLIHFSLGVDSNRILEGPFILLAQKAR